MTIREIVFVSREVAETLLFYQNTAAISVTDPGKRQASLPTGLRKILRLSFFDAIPGDEFSSTLLPGFFDYLMAKSVIEFVDQLHAAESSLLLVVHCEQGLSRSAAIALFASSYTNAPLANRSNAGQANPWVLDQLLAIKTHLDVEIPEPTEPSRLAY